jgi:Amt family ammonium transporter
MVATATALLGWLLVERIRDGHGTSLGAASGAVAGLVAITPACAFIVPWAAVLLGLLAGAICAMAVGLKFRFGFDDSLDVVGVHLVGGIVGCLFVGFFGTTRVKASGGFGIDGLFYGGGLTLLKYQAIGAASVMVYSFVIAGILGIAINKTIGFRIDEEDEVSGIDLVEHAESGYDMTPTASGVFHSGAMSSASAKADAEVSA